MKTKKLFLFAAMLLTCVCAFAQSENGEPLKGDLNNDGIVSAADLVMMTNMILGKRAQTAAADLNGDGSVSAADYVMLVNLILKQ